MILTFVTRWLRRVVVVAALAATALILFALFRPPPQDLPWAPLVLDQPIGRFTSGKLVKLGEDAQSCAALLKSSGLKFDMIPPHGTEQCRVDDAVRLRPTQPILSLGPASVAPSCPVVAGLIVWQTQVVQPQAQRVFGKSIVRVENLGSYSCRRLYGRSQGGYSEHATANAIDIGAFVLSDGTRISVLRDWVGKGPKARFLHGVRDGACRVFSTVLSPDYNAAHRDHFHIDMADRGKFGWRACR